MKNKIFPHAFLRPFLDCMPQLFFRPKYVWFPIHLKGPMIPDPSGQLAELIVYITSTRVDLYSHQILLDPQEQHSMKFESKYSLWGKFIWKYHLQDSRLLLRLQRVNSLWPSDAIWWQRSGSTLAQVMTCCLMAPSHYLNQCWLVMISKV